MENKNLEVIQSYILTTARYKYSIYEKKILYRLVQIAQSDLKGKKLKNYIVGENLFGVRKISLRYNDIMDDDNRNHSRIKTALKSLNNKKFEYHDTKTGWEDLHRIIETPGVNNKTKELRFFVNPIMWDIILNIGGNGWRKYELETAMSFESIYSMRFYELFSKQSGEKQYTIENLKKMFELENKYNRVNDFIKRVIEPAKVELDAKSPYSFTYKKQSKKGSKKITSILFHVVHIQNNQNIEIEKKSLEKDISTVFVLGKELRDSLIRDFGFKTDGLRKNINLLESALKTFDLPKFLSEIKRTANDPAIGNPAGYVIGAVKNHLEAIEKKKTSKKSNDLIDGLTDLFDAK